MFSFMAKKYNLQWKLHTHTFNGPFSGTTQVSWYQKGKTNLDFTEARDSEWQWHQLGHMQIFTSLQTYNNASTPPLIFYRPDALLAAQPTVSKHWRNLQWKLLGSKTISGCCSMWSFHYVFHQNGHIKINQMEPFATNLWYYPHR